MYGLITVIQLTTNRTNHPDGNIVIIFMKNFKVWVQFPPSGDLFR